MAKIFGSTEANGVVVGGRIKITRIKTKLGYHLKLKSPII
jgi:hypothetical protein